MSIIHEESQSTVGSLPDSLGRSGSAADRVALELVLTQPIDIAEVIRRQAEFR